MGTRVNYEFSSDEGPAGLVLYVNNSHGDVDPDRLFADAVVRSTSISKMAVNLLSETYPTTGGNHRAGEPVFTVDLDAGDREYVLRAVFGGVFEGVPTDRPVIERHELDGTVCEIDPDSLEPVAVPFSR
jgi:hypothetical protein